MINFNQQAANIIRRACEFNEKRRSEGLAALKEDIDGKKAQQQDIFEFGMQLVLDGKDLEYVNETLSGLIGQEQDENARRLKAIQKEAVLGIQNEAYTRLFTPFNFLYK